MKAVIYARQSSGKEDISESVEAQIENCVSLAVQEGFDVIGIFRDLNSSGELYPEGAENIAEHDAAYNKWLEGQSGNKNNRHGLGELIKILPESDILLVNEMTRLYRPVNHSFLENYIHNLLQINNITVIQVQGGEIDLSKFDQQLVLTLKNRILYEDLRKKRENSIHAFKIKRNSGKLCCGSRIFAIRYEGNDKISVDPEKAEIVKKIYKRILEHAPLNSIVRECNQNAGCYLMYPSLLYSIARQPLYAGFQYNTEGELIRNTQITGQELISIGDWSAVQKIMNGKQGKKGDTVSHWLPLSGRVFCGICGSRLVCRIDHGKVYYTCNKQKFDPAYKNCSESRIRFETGAYGENALYDAVIPLLTFGLMEKYNKGVFRREFINGKYIHEITVFFQKGYLTKTQACRIMTKIQKMEYNSSDVLENDLQTVLTCYIQQIIERKITHEMYEEFLKWTDLKAVIYDQTVEFHTVAGVFSLLRVKQSNRKWMPEWSIRFRKYFCKKNRHKIQGIAVCYFTGKREKLINHGTVKVFSR